MENNNKTKYIKFSNFINKKNIGKLNIWTLGHIPNNKKPNEKYSIGEYHWGNYYEYLKLQIEMSIEKPQLIILDNNSFYHFMQDCIIHNLKIETLII